jgi:PKD domain/Putative Ig domain/FlgD Ig-like domain
MRNRAFLKVVLLGLLTFAFAPGIAAASSQGQNLTEMLASNTAERATAVSGPIIAASPGSHDYGVVNNGSSASFNLQVTNTGDVFLNVFSINVSDPAFHTGTISGGGLSPGASAMVPVTFQPTDGLLHTGVLTFTSDATNPSPTINLVGQGNDCPTLDPIGDKSAAAFVNLSFLVVGHDDTDTVDDVLVYSMTSNLPVGALFNVNTGAFSWTPGAGDGGSYTATFDVSDGRCSSAPQTITIDVTVGNNPPVADAGGPYVGVTGQPVQFSSAGTSDPDAGQTLTYSWTFGDGNGSPAPNPSHSYALAGNYVATLTVTDDGTPQLSAVAVAGVIIKEQVAAGIYLKNGATSIRAHGGGRLGLGIQETDFPLTQIITSTIRMHSSIPNTTTPEISPLAKTFTVGDINGDGVQDLDCKFLTSDIAALTANLGNNTSVNLIITADVQVTGGTVPLVGQITVTIKTGGGALVSASAYPNPFNPQTSIAYSVQKAGTVSVRIYSIDGRLVRTLVDNQYTMAGTHEVGWNGRDNLGHEVRSGIYFVQSVLNGSDRAVTKISLMK